MEDNASIRVITAGDRTVIAGTPGTPLLSTPDDVVDLIGAALENGAWSLLLYAENLSERFFDLSSGEAGAILQKLRNYHMRLAVVALGGSARMSRMFGEMAREESRGSDFRLFEDEASALAWLAASP
jgi:uncharacterized protein DUF4180